MMDKEWKRRRRRRKKKGQTQFVNDLFHISTLFVSEGFDECIILKLNIKQKDDNKVKEKNNITVCATVREGSRFEETITVNLLLFFFHSPQTPEHVHRHKC